MSVRNLPVAVHNSKVEWSVGKAKLPVDVSDENIRDTGTPLHSLRVAEVETPGAECLGFRFAMLGC
jgi:hypothetical protein